MSVGARARVETPAAAPGEIIAEAARVIIARGEGTPVTARDPVNLPEIRAWTQAMADHNPVYTDPAAGAASVHGGLVAPPAMLQVWTMPGLRRPQSAPGENPFSEMLDVLDAQGYTSVIATNSEQTYDRYLIPGDVPIATTSLESVVGPKKTAMGEGYFVTSRVTWRVGDDIVGRMLFRVLKFRPAPQSPARGAATVTEPPPYPLAPAISPDTAFFWSGLALGELRIQRCAACGALRHPPGPLCPACHSTEREHTVASGLGEIYSYVVHHHPAVPGRTAPFVVAVVALPEGVRMVGNVDADPAAVAIGAPVRVYFDRVDAELVLPSWRLAGDSDE